MWLIRHWMTVLEALSRRFRGCLLMKLMHAEYLVLLADSEKMLSEKIKMWPGYRGEMIKGKYWKDQGNEMS